MLCCTHTDDATMHPLCAAMCVCSTLDRCPVAAVQAHGKGYRGDWEGIEPVYGLEPDSDLPAWVGRPHNYARLQVLRPSQTPAYYEPRHITDLGMQRCRLTPLGFLAYAAVRHRLAYFRPQRSYHIAALRTVNPQGLLDAVPATPETLIIDTADMHNSSFSGASQTAGMVLGSTACLCSGPSPRAVVPVFLVLWHNDVKSMVYGAVT